MSGPNVLISGAGIAGTVLAYWLTKAGAKVTIVERDSELRLTGQSLDVRGPGVDVIQAMGVEEQIRQKTTKETGLAFVDATGRKRAVFLASGDPKLQSFTSEFEIFRGDLAKIFYELTEDNVEYIFGDYVKGFDQDGQGVRVEFTNGTPGRAFDLVVAADGLGSQIRGMLLGTTTKEHIKSLHAYIAFFTIRHGLLGGSGLGQWYNAPGGRTVILRSDPNGATRANLGVVSTTDSEILHNFRIAQKTSTEAVKELFSETFQDAGWLAPQVLDGMRESNDFYSQDIAQIVTDTLYKGRVVLLGDAGYCPSPFSGMGTSLAIAGAYVLAGEIMSHSQDMHAALERYQTIMLPYARSAQKLPPGAPQIANPQTQWGINILVGVLSWVAWLGLDKLLVRLASSIPAFGPGFVLPKYEWPTL